MDNEKLKISTTTDGQPPREGHENASAPAPINPSTGQHAAYWVLSEAERAKGFVRPVRTSYKHVGVRPKYPVRDLTDDEKYRFDPDGKEGYVKWEQYPESESPKTGKLWTEKELNSGCGQVTTMGQVLAETYARDPKYYGATFCANCRYHFPVGADGEFEWLDGQKVGT